MGDWNGGVFLQLHFGSTCSVFDQGKKIDGSVLWDSYTGKSVYELLTRVPCDDLLLAIVGKHAHGDVSQHALLKFPSVLASLANSHKYEKNCL